MKRILVVGFCAVLIAAETEAKELEVIDLGAPENAAQDIASKIPAAEAKDFIDRLDRSVGKAIQEAQSGKAGAVSNRNQAIQLAKFQSEGERFGVLFTPFAKCNSAAIDAAFSWQGLIGQNERQFVEYHKSYQANSAACHDAAK